MENDRTGFGLMELVVSIAVISILLALIAPAVMQARASATTHGCRDQLRNIGSAIQQFHESHKHYPNHMDGEHPFVKIMDRLDLSSEQTRVREATGGPEANWRWNSQWKFKCPASRENTFYAFNQGTPGQDIKDWHNGLPITFRFSAASIRDGLSNTAMLSELYTSSRRMPKGADSTEYARKFPRDVQWSFNIAKYDTLDIGNLLTASRIHDLTVGLNQPPHFSATHYTHISAPNGLSGYQWLDGTSSDQNFRASGSVHEGCVNLLLADGSVRTVSDTVDLSLWQALGTRAGGEVFDNTAF